MNFGLAQKMEESINQGGPVDLAREVSLDNIPFHVRRVIDIAMREGIPYSLRRLPSPDLTISQIAESCGTELPLLMRGALYRGQTSKKSVLLLHSGASTVSERALAGIFGEVLVRADRASTEKITGFDAEAIPPIGLATRLPIMMDETLVRFGRTWCMAGERDLVMTVPTTVLARAIAARLVKVD